MLFLETKDCGMRLKGVALAAYEVMLLLSPLKIAIKLLMEGLDLDKSGLVLMLVFNQALGAWPLVEDRPIASCFISCASRVQALCRMSFAMKHVGVFGLPHG
jgi:hypothetical protein